MISALLQTFSKYRSGSRKAVVTLSLLAALTVLAAITGQAQTYTILHNFTAGNDGATPKAGLTMDRGGNLYGTTSTGGDMGGTCHNLSGCGTVFKLAHSGSGWTLDPLYVFTGQSDGSTPSSRVSFGPDGALYGTALYEGDQSCGNCGVVYKLNPPSTFCRTVLCSWQETPIFSFHDYQMQGMNPSGDLVFDQQGNIYGTAVEGGNPCYVCGVIFELTRSGGSWSETVLYNFPGTTLANPQSGVIFDASGNLYGTAGCRDNCYSGGAFELTPSGGGWTEKNLYEFDYSYPGDAVPGGLVMDPMGHLYGGTIWGGQSNFGTVYELSSLPNGSWNLSTLYTFTQSSGGPYANLTMDSAGNLYGTAHGDGAHSRGSVFKLTPSSDGWIYTDLHDFDGTDGSNPISSVLIDATGNLYGTTTAGGQYGYGVVWQIAP